MYAILRHTLEQFITQKNETCDQNIKNICMKSIILLLSVLKYLMGDFANYRDISSCMDKLKTLHLN